jgi:hypothetical protein
MDKHCVSCDTTKPVAEFNWRRKEKGYRDNLCRDCRAAYHAAHYAANRQRYIDNAKARTRRTLEERTRLIVDYLEAHPCADCGEADVVVLEFDHIGPKEFNVSTAIRGERSLRAMLDEVVCANCHKRRTAQRAGFRRLLFVQERKLAVEPREPPRVDGAGDRDRTGTIGLEVRDSTIELHPRGATPEASAT